MVFEQLFVYHIIKYIFPYYTEMPEEVISKVT